MGRAIRAYFELLFDGDGLTWIITGVFLVICLGVLLLWYKAARDLRRDDEERKRKWGGGKKHAP